MRFCCSSLVRGRKRSRKKRAAAKAAAAAVKQLRAGSAPTEEQSQWDDVHRSADAANDGLGGETQQRQLLADGALLRCMWVQTQRGAVFSPGRIIGYIWSFKPKWL